MKDPILVGCIQTLQTVIRTRFFYINQEKEEARDVTAELCNAITDFNRQANQEREKGNYAMIIPYRYKNGLAEYSFGCGLSHYLQEAHFKEIASRSHHELSFPMQKCKLSMYTPSDVKGILNCRDVFDKKIVMSLKSRYSYD